MAAPASPLTALVNGAIWRGMLGTLAFAILAACAWMTFTETMESRRIHREEAAAMRKAEIAEKWQIAVGKARRTIARQKAGIRGGLALGKVMAPAHSAPTPAAAPQPAAEPAAFWRSRPWLSTGSLSGL